METNGSRRDEALRFPGTARDYLALAQGAYYLVTGAWPLLDRASFERIAGPKVDFWLVHTVGLLVAVIGKELLWAGLGRADARSAQRLGIGSAGSLAAVELVYGLRGRISKVHLLEGLVELGLAAAWLTRLVGRPHSP